MIILNKNILEKLIGLVCSNNSRNNDVLLNQEFLSQQSFLQKKRNLENNYNIQKYVNILSPNRNDNGPIQYYPDFYRENHLFSPKLINLEFNDINKFKFDDPSNLIKQNFSNNTIYNIDFNLKGEHFNKYSAKKYFFENIKEDINKINNIYYKNIKGSPNDKNNTKDSFDYIKSKNSLSNKNIIFEVYRTKEKKQKKKLSNKKIIQNENNNQIRVFKNKKLVYVNSFLLNSNSTSKTIKRLNKVNFIGINRRGSKYRGVSKNGNQYQVLIMINKKKLYIGSFPVEEDAARIYDILSLKFRGIKAKTNYYYSYEQIKKILETDINIKNIYQIISKFLN